MAQSLIWLSFFCETFLVFLGYTQQYLFGLTSLQLSNNQKSINFEKRYYLIYMTINTIIQLIPIGVILFFAFFIIRYFHRFLFRLNVLLNPKKKESWIPLLEKEFPYYGKLSEDSKRLFLEKLNYFYHGKNFIPKRGFKIDEKIKILICASAAQLTLGLPLLKLAHFGRIWVFRKSSYQRRLEQRTYSDIQNEEGRMFFSWEQVQSGFDDPTDGYNAALHKLAEALLFEDGKLNEEHDFLDKKYLRELFQLFHSEKTFLRSGNHTFLDKTAGKNFEDFFAVSIESYFERPLLLKKHMPDLYSAMSGILNQDTAELEENFNNSQQ